MNPVLQPGRTTQLIVFAPDDADDKVPRARRARRVAVSLAAGWVIVAGLLLASAASHARAGEAAAQEALGALGTGTDRANDVTEAMGRARDEFAVARTRSSNSVLAPLRIVPVAGRQLRSFTALSRASERVTGIAATSMAAAKEVLAAEGGTGPGRVTALQRVSHIIDGAERAIGDVDLGPEEHLVAPLAVARDRLASAVADGGSALRRGAVVTSAVAELLGGPRRYLVLAANNAEMRAGSGMFLSAGVLESRDGALFLGPMRPTAELALPGAGVALEAELAERWGWLHPGREWRNLGVSPRFDVTGRLAADMWSAAGGAQVDGVLAIDVEAVRAVLAATGPVEIQGASVDAGDVVERLLHGQYLGLVEEDQAGRRDQLGQLAAAALDAAQSRTYDLGRLAAELGRAARGRHLLAWSADPREQRAWETAGVDGALEPESLLVAVLNRGGNKLDRFLGVSTELTVEPTPAGSDVTVAVDLSNRTPPGEPAYVAGPHPDSGLAAGDYLGIVSVQVPGSASSVRIDDGPPPVTDGPDGPTRVVATRVLLAAGESRRVVVRFRLPASLRTLRLEASARVPPAAWRMGETGWDDSASRRVSW